MRTRRSAVSTLVTIGLVLLTAQPALAAAPTITSITPKVSLIGEEVTIAGTAFATASLVTFSAADFGDRIEAEFVVDSPTQIKAVVPAGVRTGNVIVHTAEGSAAKVTFIALQPEIHRISPIKGLPGSAVGVQGDNLVVITSVTFNGVEADFSIDDDGYLDAYVPKGATSGSIVVTNKAGSAISDQTFTRLYSPRIDGFWPKSGPPKTWVKLRGAHLAPIWRVYWRHSIPMRWRSVSDAVLWVKIPAGEKSSKILVSVRNAGYDLTDSKFLVRR